MKDSTRVTSIGQLFSNCPKQSEQKVKVKQKTIRVNLTEAPLWKGQ